MFDKILNLDGIQILNKDQQATINGGGSYTCYCGFAGGPYEDQTVQVEAGSVGDALNSMNCGGAGATCSGNRPQPGGGGSGGPQIR